MFLAVFLPDENGGDVCTAHSRKCARRLPIAFDGANGRAYDDGDEDQCCDELPNGDAYVIPPVLLCRFVKIHALARVTIARFLFGYRQNAVTGIGNNILKFRQYLRRRQRFHPRRGRYRRKILLDNFAHLFRHSVSKRETARRKSLPMFSQSLRHASSSVLGYLSLTDSYSLGAAE